MCIVPYYFYIYPYILIVPLLWWRHFPAGINKVVHLIWSQHDDLNKTWCQIKWFIRLKDVSGSSLTPSHSSGSGRFRRVQTEHASSWRSPEFRNTSEFHTKSPDHFMSCLVCGDVRTMSLWTQSTQICDLVSWTLEHWGSTESSVTGANLRFCSKPPCWILLKIIVKQLN